MDYDENGNWKRDYEDRNIPFDELALPRNEEESRLYHIRFKEKNGIIEKVIAETPYEKRKDYKSILESFRDPYYESEEEFLNEQAKLSKRL